MFYSDYGYEAERSGDGQDTIRTSVQELVKKMKNGGDLCSNKKPHEILNREADNSEWIVSKRMNTDRCMDALSATVSESLASDGPDDIFTEFACDFNGNHNELNEWMEKPISLAARRMSHPSGVLPSNTSFTDCRSDKYKWHVSAGRNIEKEEKHSASCPVATNGYTLSKLSPQCGQWDTPKDVHDAEFNSASLLETLKSTTPTLTNNVSSYSGIKTCRVDASTDKNPTTVMWGACYSIDNKRVDDTSEKTVQPQKILNDEQKRCTSICRM